MTLTFIDRVERASSATSIEMYLSKIASSYGLPSIFGGLIPRFRVSANELKDRTLLRIIPIGWLSRYYDNGYLYRDPVVSYLRQFSLPFTWRDAYVASPFRNDVTLIHGEASAFGLKSGFVVPISLPGGELAAVSFGGDRADIGPAEKAILAFAANYAVGKLLYRRTDRQYVTADISPREHECLRWAADGKTDWEIAVILGIARSTVLKHLKSARGKLGAVTKGHAIALAFRAGLLW